jgi:hypothetical protein
MVVVPHDDGIFAKVTMAERVGLIADVVPCRNAMGESRMIVMVGRLKKRKRIAHKSQRARASPSMDYPATIGRDHLMINTLVVDRLEKARDWPCPTLSLFGSRS